MRISHPSPLSLQEPLLLQLVLARAAQQGKPQLLQEVLQMFAHAGWQPTLGGLYKHVSRWACSGYTPRDA